MPPDASDFLGGIPAKQWGNDVSVLFTGTTMGIAEFTMQVIPHTQVYTFYIRPVYIIVQQAELVH